MKLGIKIGDIKEYIGIMGKYKENGFEEVNIESLDSSGNMWIRGRLEQWSDISLKTIFLDQALTIFGYGVDYDSFTHEERREYISLRENLMKALDSKFMFSEEE